MSALATIGVLLAMALIAVYCGDDSSPDDWDATAYRRWLRHYGESVKRRE